MIIRTLMLAAAFSAAPLSAQQTEDENVDVESTVDGNVEREVEIRRVDRDGNVVEETTKIDDEQVRKMMSDCPGRMIKLEVAMKGKDGVENNRKIKLCGESDDPDQWIETLQSAKEQVLRMDALSAAARTKLLDDIDAEIARTRDEG